MSSELEQWRERVLAARRNPEPLPPEQQEIVRRHARAREKGWAVSDLVVTRTGEIQTIQQAGSQTVSRVTTEVFAAVDEVALAERHLPPGYWRYEDDDFEGWAYEVTTSLGDMFAFFLYFDRFQRVYRVRLLAPDLERLGLAHETHLFADGHLCLSDRGPGERMFNNAYAKSAMWADGISRMLRGHAWPWGE
ncbi:hypothetical protein [Geodermatophilus sp. URMC 62]|uniref:hypothetical protein n=1 Tax=Geodermatophilus sp. URMC 62 TaxID=3423414 RepID=UPI00406C0BD3